MKKTGVFLTKLEFERVLESRKAFFFFKKKEIVLRLLKDLVYMSSDGIRYVAKKELMTDGASIPKFAWGLVGHPFDLYLESAVIHDELYRQGVIPRKRADWVLLDGMKTQGISFWKRHTMHKMVRTFGGIHNWINRKGRHEKMESVPQKKTGTISD